MWEKSKRPFSVWCQDSNSQPFKHELSPITTRPGLPPYFFLPWPSFNLTLARWCFSCYEKLQSRNCLLRTLIFEVSIRIGKFNFDFYFGIKILIEVISFKAMMTRQFSAKKLINSFLAPSWTFRFVKLTAAQVLKI